MNNNFGSFMIPGTFVTYATPVTVTIVVVVVVAIDIITLVHQVTLSALIDLIVVTSSSVGNSICDNGTTDLEFNRSLRAC